MVDVHDLYPYQETGAAWLAPKKCALLADEMGLGKSAQAISAADLISATRILVICPAVATINWLREFDKFSPWTRETFVVTSGRSLPPSRASLIVSSYDLAVRLHRAGVWNTQHFDLLVIDESHFLKSLDAQRTKAILGKNGICRRARKTWCLTGTPMPNHPGELWVLLRTFGQTKLSYYDFCRRFCLMAIGWRVGDPLQIVGRNPERDAELKELLAPIMLRRMKEDVLQDLPPIHFGEVTVLPGEVPLVETATFFDYVYPNDRTPELNVKMAKEHNLLAMNLQALKKSERYQGAFNDHTTATIKMLEALAGSVSTLRRYNGLQKVDAVVEMLTEELDSDAYEKVVIFCVHRDVIEILRRRLEKYGPVTLYGKTSPASKQRNVDRFQNNPNCRVFIGNILAAGTAVTLTASNQVVFVEQEWTPGHNAQAAMRCHRIGQTRPVTVRFITIAGSIDEKINAILRRKTQDIAAILNDGKIEKTENLP